MARRGRVETTVVIGGGLNGLVAATCLARRGRSVIVLERQASPGGGAATTEIAPGFRAPSLAHTIGPIDAEVIRAIGLDETDIAWIRPGTALIALGARGEVARFSTDASHTASALRDVSDHDAARWPDFAASLNRITAIVAKMNRRPPPDVDQPTFADGLALLSTGRAARQLGTRDLSRLLRYAPMAVADLASEWFESDVVRAAIAAHAVFGNFAGPWSAGTGGMFLQRMAADPTPLGASLTARGGPGAVSAALARQAARSGVTIRAGARVTRILTRENAVASVILENGEEIAAATVVSAVDPKQTFLTLVDPGDLPPTFRERMRHYRNRGVTAKINLALGAAPRVAGLDGDPLTGRVLIAPSTDDIERAFDAAKYGAFSPVPWVEFTVPSMADPDLAPQGQHVMSVVVHYAPRELSGTTWDAASDAFGEATLSVLERHIAGLGSLIVGRELWSPADLEERWGLSGGHIFHGETTLDQWWAGRPLLGWSRYATPIGGLFLTGAGTHPGGGSSGLSGLLAARAVLASGRP